MKNHEIPTSLIRRFQTGDISAFEEIILKESAHILTFIRKYYRRAEIAEDAYQEACLRLWKYREQLREPKYFRSWMFQIVRSSIFEILKKSNWDVEISFEDHFTIFTNKIDGSEDPRQKTARIELGEILQEEVKCLKPSAQEMIGLRFSAGLNLREISEVLNIPHGTVCYEMNMALKKIRKQLNKKNLDYNVLKG